ncbi:MAG: hypothetical protein WC761_02220 [Candidatus Paceibacterota bacterium]|jgi:hypothetical protein
MENEFFIRKLSERQRSAIRPDTAILELEKHRDMWNCNPQLSPGGIYKLDNIKNPAMRSFLIHKSATPDADVGYNSYLSFTKDNAAAIKNGMLHLEARFGSWYQIDGSFSGYYRSFKFQPMIAVSFLVAEEIYWFNFSLPAAKAIATALYRIF